MQGPLFFTEKLKIPVTMGVEHLFAFEKKWHLYTLGKGPVSSSDVSTGQRLIITTTRGTVYGINMNIMFINKENLDAFAISLI